MGGWYLAAAAGIGAFVGVTEIIARYRDAPVRALGALPAWIYVGVNAGAPLAALWSIQVFEWTFGFDGPQEAQTAELVQVLAAGFGSMALFRSSLFTVRAGDTDVGIGPAGLLQILLDAADRAVDRERANPRAEAVAVIMRGVSFEKAYAALPVFCFELMQNVSVEEQERFGDKVNRLVAADIAPEIKTLSLGLALMNVVGETVLSSAVGSLGASIRDIGELPKAALPSDESLPAGARLSQRRTSPML